VEHIRTNVLSTMEELDETENDDGEEVQPAVNIGQHMLYDQHVVLVVNPKAERTGVYLQGMFWLAVSVAPIYLGSNAVVQWYEKDDDHGGSAGITAYRLGNVDEINPVSIICEAGIEAGQTISISAQQTASFLEKRRAFVEKLREQKERQQRPRRTPNLVPFKDEFVWEPPGGRKRRDATRKGGSTK